MSRWILATFFVVIAAGYLYREPLRHLAIDTITSDMFVPADQDGYDPGLTVGSGFPAIYARHEGQIIDSVDSFVLDRGMIFIAVRSVDW